MRAATTVSIGIVAGEASGDRLGAGLMQALRQRFDCVRFVGVGGEAMLGQGLETLGSMDALAVNGFFDPLAKLPQMLGLLNTLKAEFAAEPPDCFVGVDFNVFNLALERWLKRRGLPIVHYVSPSVYAWRRGRVQGVARSADRLLALFPFEKAFYAQTALDVVYVGHPLADAIDPEAGDAAGRQRARAELALGERAPVVAFLPGSRMGEIKMMLEGFLEVAEILHSALPDALFVIPCPTAAAAEAVARAVANRQQLPLRIHRGDGHLPLMACNVALVKAGTATLEAMLLRRSMVVTYRLGRLAWHLARLLVHTEYVALPNILAGRALVPELLQNAATPAALAEKLLVELDKSTRHPEHLQAFSELHQRLRRNANERAADAVTELLRTR